MDKTELFGDYNIPYICRECGGIMIFRGVGEYCCEDCKAVDYDDYGKVRLYIEKRAGATAPEIERATGVSQKKIRNMLREKRFQIAADSVSFLHCEKCGKSIRCGRFCDECEIQYHRSLEENQRQLRQKNIKGTGIDRQGDEGHRRFMRKDD